MSRRGIQKGSSALWIGRRSIVSPRGSKVIDSALTSHPVYLSDPLRVPPAKPEKVLAHPEVADLPLSMFSHAGHLWGSTPITTFTQERMSHAPALSNSITRSREGGNRAIRILGRLDPKRGTINMGTLLTAKLWIRVAHITRIIQRPWKRLSSF